MPELKKRALTLLGSLFSYLRVVLRRKYFWVVFLITCSAFFLRSYKHESLLFFEVDQARDWRIVEIARQYGIGNLPLLGPGMNASTFRIGPIFHYIQYAAAFIFSNSPEAIAYPDLLFSVLTVPLFYFFLREFFSKKISTMLSALLSCSLFAIEYGRFAMNSNSIPFFMLLVFYSLLRVSREEKRPQRWLWVIILSLALGIIIQLHALTLVGMPIVIVAYLLITKTKMEWKEWLVGFFILFTLISPIFINEWMSGFQSVGSFLSGADSRQESQKTFSFSKKITKGIQEIDRNYVEMLASGEIIKSLDPALQKEGAWEMVKRNSASRRGVLNLFLSFATVVFFAAPFFYLAKKYRRFKENRQKRNFIVLLFIWQIFFGFLIVEVVFVQHSRYYLALLPAPFILLGIYFQIISQRKKYGPKIVVAAFSMLLFFSLFQVVKWFQMVEGYGRSENITRGEFILDPFYDVTWGQMTNIEDYLKEAYKESNGRDIQLMSPDQFYSRSIRYPLIYRENMPIKVFSNGTRDKNDLYFSIQPTDVQNTEKNREIFSGLSRFTFQKDFEAVDSVNFGTLTVLSVRVKDSVLGKSSNAISVKKLKENFKEDKADSRHLVQSYSWNQFFKYLKKHKNI